MAGLPSEIKVTVEKIITELMRTRIYRCNNHKCENNLFNRKYSLWGNDRNAYCNLKTIELDETGQCHKYLRNDENE